MDYHLTLEENRKRRVEKLKKNLSSLNQVLWLNALFLFINVALLSNHLSNGKIYIITAIAIFIGIIGLIVSILAKRAVRDLLRDLENN